MNERTNNKSLGPQTHFVEANKVTNNYPADTQSDD